MAELLAELVGALAQGLSPGGLGPIGFGSASCNVEEYLSPKIYNKILEADKHGITNLQNYANYIESLNVVKNCVLKKLDKQSISENKKRKYNSQLSKLETHIIAHNNILKILNAIGHNNPSINKASNILDYNTYPNELRQLAIDSISEYNEKFQSTGKEPPTAPVRRRPAPPPPAPNPNSPPPKPVSRPVAPTPAPNPNSPPPKPVSPPVAPPSLSPVKHTPAPRPASPPPRPALPPVAPAPVQAPANNKKTSGWWSRLTKKFRGKKANITTKTKKQSINKRSWYQKTRSAVKRFPINRALENIYKMGNKLDGSSSDKDIITKLEHTITEIKAKLDTLHGNRNNSGWANSLLNDLIYFSQVLKIYKTYYFTTPESMATTNLRELQAELGHVNIKGIETQKLKLLAEHLEKDITLAIDAVCKDQPADKCVRTPKSMPKFNTNNVATESVTIDNYDVKLATLVELLNNPDIFTDTDKQTRVKALIKGFREYFANKTGNNNRLKAQEKVMKGKLEALDKKLKPMVNELDKLKATSPQNTNRIANLEAQIDRVRDFNTATTATTRKNNNYQINKIIKESPIAKLERDIIKLGRIFDSLDTIAKFKDAGSSNLASVIPKQDTVTLESPAFVPFNNKFRTYVGLTPTVPRRPERRPSNARPVVPPMPKQQPSTALTSRQESVSNLPSANIPAPEQPSEPKSRILNNILNNTPRPTKLGLNNQTKNILRSKLAGMHTESPLTLEPEQQKELQDRLNNYTSSSNLSKTAIAKLNIRQRIANIPTKKSRPPVPARRPSMIPSAFRHP